MSTTTGTSSSGSGAHGLGCSAHELRTALAANGHVTVEGLVPPEVVARLRSRLALVLARKYETGVFPDEAYYRPGSTLPDVPRHVVNAWKCDRQIASVAVSPYLASVAARLFGWDSLRLAVDTVWMKPPGSLRVDFHREFEYFTSLDPPEVASCWIALDAMGPENGSLEFASESHLWRDPELAVMRDLFTRHRGRDAVTAVGDALGQTTMLQTVTCQPGACTFFDGRVWHGSEPNRSSSERWAYGIHWVHGDALLGTAPPTYLFGRYKLMASNVLHESFFPVVWSRTGERSSWIESFLAGGALGG